MYIYPLCVWVTAQHHHVWRFARLTVLDKDFMEAEDRTVEGVVRDTARYSAKTIFADFIDGEADLTLTDGKEEHLRDWRQLARLRWLQAVQDFKGIKNIIPPLSIISDDACGVFLALCAAQDVQVLHIAILLHMGADPNAAILSNHRAIHRLAESLQSAVCGYLVECKARCDAVETNRSQTPLILACRTPLARKHPRQQLRTVDTLLSSGETLLDHVDCTGNTALDYAIIMRKVLVVRRLLAAGASVVNTSWYRNTVEQHKALNADTNLAEQGDLPDLRNVECIDYNVSDSLLNMQRALLSKQALCDRLLNYRLREELAVLKRRNGPKVWGSGLYTGGHIGEASTESKTGHIKHTKAVENTAESAAAEARRANRHAHREGKNQARAAKVQRAAEVEREQQKELYMKRVEKEYHVSFKGLFA